MEEIVNKDEQQSLPFSDELTNLLSFIKEKLSEELPTLTIDTDYFLLGVLGTKNSKLYDRLDSCLMSSAMENIYNTFYQLVSSKALSAVKTSRKPAIFDKTLADALFSAEQEAKDMDSSEITTEHVFLAILADSSESNKIRKVFNKAGLTYGIMKSKMMDGSSEPSSEDSLSMPGMRIMKFNSKREAEKFFKEMQSKIEEPIDFSDPMGLGTGKKKKGKNSYINSYCTDITALAEKGKIEPLIGRDRETAEIIRILGRRKKNNCIILGGEGVGKTALGESLALKIVNGDVPEFLLGRRLVSLDMTALMAGTTLRGMFEERVKGLIDDIKADPSFILFMDNIGAILADKGKNDYEISSMLARALENGEIQVIGTSDYTSYRKTFDKDPSLARRFQKIVLEAPSIDESYSILNGIKDSYEEYHGVRYTDKAIAACVNLSNRYISERNLPDSAIDVLDEAGAYKGSIQDNTELKNLRLKIAKIEKTIEAFKSQKDFDSADNESENLIKAKQAYNEAKKAYDENRKENPIIVDVDDILNVVSVKTNIPINSLTSDDKDRLMHINDRLKEGVVGQDTAIDTICRAIKRNRIGLRRSGCMYSCMAIGKTGTGKTLIAKKLAKELFGDEKALVRFDMSEYSDKSTVNKLIGSNPGYVGFEEGGRLTETIKNKKHCVLLLDEIEKADPEIYNIFLQVLDEGHLTDNSGMKVDFSNVIVMFTSNVGAKTASDFSKGIGFNENTDENSKRILTKQLKNRFPPEFLNRVDDVIYFNSLTDENLKDIIKIEIGKLETKINDIGYDMEYDDTVVDYIFNIVKEEKEYGARPIMRTIQNSIEDKITDALLEQTYDKGYKFKISCCLDLSDITVA